MWMAYYISYHGHLKHCVYSLGTQKTIQNRQPRSSKLTMGWLAALPPHQISPSTIFSPSKKKNSLFRCETTHIKNMHYLTLQSIRLHFFQDLAPSITPPSFVFFPSLSLSLYSILPFHSPTHSILLSHPCHPHLPHCTAKYTYDLLYHIVPSSLLPNIKLLKRIYLPCLFPHQTLTLHPWDTRLHFHYLWKPLFS